MSTITIQLEFDPETGKKNILIGYESDADRTRAEHESRHREIIQNLISSGILQPDETGKVVVSRVDDQDAAGTKDELPPGARLKEKA